jgi:hypothetical protein
VSRRGTVVVETFDNGIEFGARRLLGTIPLQMVEFVIASHRVAVFVGSVFVVVMMLRPSVCREPVIK